MGLDSIEIVMCWEESLGISIANKEAEALQTPRQAVDLIATKVVISEGGRGACLSLRAFNRVRNAFIAVEGVLRSRVRPDAPVRNLVSFPDRWFYWHRIRHLSGLPALPSPGLVFPRTVGDLTRWAVVHAAHSLKPPGEAWSRSEIRHVVRAGVTEVMGVETFSDDDEFVRDIGVN